MSKPGELFLWTFLQELKTPPNGANAENEELTWPYYSLLDAIMSGRAVNSPPCLVASASPGTGEQILEGDDGVCTAAGGFDKFFNADCVLGLAS